MNLTYLALLASYLLDLAYLLTQDNTLKWESQELNTNTTDSIIKDNVPGITPDQDAHLVVSNTKSTSDGHDA